MNQGGCDAHTGYGNGGYVDYQNPSGDAAMFTLSGCASGLASLSFRYAYGTESGDLEVLVNGKDTKTLHFPATGGWVRGAPHAVVLRRPIFVYRRILCVGIENDCPE